MNWKVGTQKEISSDQILSFHQQGCGVFVEGDPVNLFVVNKEGRRYFLGHFSNALLFQFSPYIAGKGLEIVLISEGKSTLWEWNLEELQKECSQNPEQSKALTRQVEDWSRILWEQISPSKLKATNDIHAFSQEFAHALPLYIDRIEEEERDIVDVRTREEREALGEALQDLKTILIPATLEEIGTASDPLIRACQVLARFLKIELFIPKEVVFAADDREKIDLICEASQIRRRKVVLSSTFFTQDQEPLIAFLGVQKVAVALIPTPAGYKVIDAASSRRVTQEIANKLARDAYKLYVPLPPKVKTGLGVLKFILSHQPLAMFFLVLFAIIASLFAFCIPIVTKFLFSEAIPNSDGSLICYLMLGMICASIGMAGFYFLRDLLLLRMEGVGAHLFNTALWDRLLKLSPNFFRRYTIGDLYWRLSSVDEMRRQIGRTGWSILITALFSVLYLGIMAVYDKTLTQIAGGCALFGLLVTVACSYWKSSVLNRCYDIQGGMRGLLIQILSGIGKLRTVGVEKSAFAHWATLFAKSKAFQMRAQNIQNLVTALGTGLPLFSIWMIFDHIARYRGISMPDFLAFNLAFGSFVIAIYPAFTTWMMLVNQAPVWRRARIILEEPLEQYHAGTVHRLEGEVLIDSIVFGYDPKMPPVLNGITMAIKRQEFIGIVGASGSGKSTLVRLLLGFEKPYSGAIYYDQKNLEYLNMRDIRKQIGVVFQGSAIMAGSLYDNLVCGGIYTKEQIESALTLSGFAQDLEAMPMGLQTAMPTDGGTLSGGQKQRLLLARAIISNPSLLIFDEATSAFDNKAQEVVSANIANMKVTRIVIAHRLSTIRNVDRIYVIDKGVVAQVGTYDELAKTTGLFSEMLQRQKL